MTKNKPKYTVEEIQTAVDIVIGDDGFRGKEVIEVLKVIKKQINNEQETRITDGQDLSWPLALAPGPRTKLQAASGKLQASSGKLDKIKL